MKFSAIGISAVCVLCFCTCTNIEGVDRPRLALELYNRAKVLGLGLLRPNAAQPMDYEEAACLVGKSIDYYNGKVMKIKVPANGEGDEIYTWLYNRDNGEGAAEEVVEMLKKSCEAGCKAIPVQSD